MQKTNLKKVFLYAFIVSISVSALLGIAAVITGTIEQNQRILLSALTITLASFSMFLNGIFFEKMLGRILPTVGFVLTAAAALLCIAAIWSAFELRPLITILILLFTNFFLFPFSFYYEERKTIWLPLAGICSSVVAAALSIRAVWEFSSNDVLRKTFFVAFVIALAAFYLSLIFMVTLSKRFAWVTLTAQAAVWLLVAVSIYAIIFEPDSAGWLSELILRVSVILAIVITAATVMIPIFYRLSFGELALPEKISVKEIDQQIARLKKQLEALEKKRREIIETAD